MCEHRNRNEYNIYKLIKIIRNYNNVCMYRNYNNDNDNDSNVCIERMGEGGGVGDTLLVFKGGWCDSGISTKLNLD